MDLKTLIGQLEAGATAIAALARGVSEQQARWKPRPEDWSILEVINHLYDEEREDFRLRARLTIESPEQPLPPIDPEGWVVQRSYNTRDLHDSLAAFLEERSASMQWLRELGEQRWEAHLNHPHLAELRAGDILHSWAAHDLLHIRQLNELRYAHQREQSAPYRIEYAGEW